MHTALFSNDRQDWATPWTLFRKLDASHGQFTLDVCALPHNAKCEAFFTPENDALRQKWSGLCWMNPPYGREIGRWMEKAVVETRNGNAERVVCLLPARTDTAWWHDYVEPYAEKPIFLRGRVKFEGAASGAPFPSVIVVFNGPHQQAALPGAL